MAENTKIKKKIRFKTLKILLVLFILALCGVGVFAFKNGDLFVYTVQPHELAIERLFGKYFRSTEAGLHFTLPYPIVKKDIIDAKVVKRIEIGYTTQADSVAKNTDEASMMTGDENIIVLEVAIQYQIADPKKYLFSSYEVNEFIANSCKTALRNVIGKHSIDDALTDEKLDIEQEISAHIKDLWIKYNLGLSLLSVQLQEVNPPKAVVGAFKDVASAREDRNTYINKAISYKEKNIPQAKASGFALIEEATAYSLERQKNAEAEVARFNAIYSNYKQNKTIIRKKLYLEMLEEVLPSVKLYVTDEKSGNLNLLNLNGGK